ncbi:hypothetical protein CKF54_02010 [Psittacicella hinzii]|uniref:Uncharacterized protein n=1 Tax=Psittacicella hinzii TaxID=2028575 RepID=A0A3A1Y6I6_9GAMM|nr:hypothetical protein [Psittacicella hinzii]RIY33883.1 hypothetical protein CKF54_02010 [Psittacicella hinzii]
MLKRSLLSLSLATCLVATSGAAVTVATWNDGKSSLTTLGQIRMAYNYQDKEANYQTYYQKTNQATWNLRSRIIFSLKQHLTDDLEVGAHLRLVHIFMSRHASSVRWSYTDASYGTKTYTYTHGKNPIRPDRFHVYLESKTFGKLVVALSTGDYATQQGSADVRDFGTTTYYLSNQARAITYAYLDTQDRLVRYDSPNISEDLPLSASVSYGDMRSPQVNGAGETKRRYDTEVSGALMYQVGEMGQVQLLAAKKHEYVNYTTKYATEGYQLGLNLRVTPDLRIRAEVGTAHEETATLYNRYKGAGIDLSYKVGKFTPYAGALYMNVQTKYKDGATAQQARNVYELFVGSTYTVASKVFNAFNFNLFAEALHSYTDYYKNYGARLGEHTYAFAGGLLVTW